jgi:hypothetical protein
MGTMTAFPPTPVNPDARPPSIEADIDQEPVSNIPGAQMTGPDIEADIEADMKKMK